MGQWVGRVTKQILPEAFLKLGYNEKDKITLLAFDDECEIHNFTVASLGDCPLRARGGTEMKPAIEALKTYLKSVKEDEGVRILAISDGEIFDKRETKEAADKLAKTYKHKLRINSQALQIFSSPNANPDTIALCSLLQLNNTKSSQLENVYLTSLREERVQQVCNLIKGDGLEFLLELRASKAILKRELWETEVVSKINLKSGDNTFWIHPKSIEALQSGTVKLEISGIPVKVVLESKQTEVNEVSSLLSDHLKHVYEYLKILRIINSDTSQELMLEIVGKYQNLEEQLDLDDSEVQLDILSQTDISSRMVYLRKKLKKRSVGFSIKMAQIANDNTINALNSAQKAEYLRATTHSMTSRGLAKRAAISGFNFDSIAQREAHQIANNLDDLLAEVKDDSAHQCSFYSMETTLGGIRAVADFTRDPNFDDCTANDILLLLNIVGIACEGPVGDFPDPMTWRVNRIYPGVFVSVSDLMVAKIQSRDPESNLTVPGNEDAIITNVIPVFEDRSIAKFLRRHAPHLLSYTCSIGMRGMIAHVVMTDGYTLCAGIWKLVEHVANNPTELTLNTFKHMVKSYDLFSGYYFEAARDCLIVDPGTWGNLSFYLQNNGLTNMIAPIYHQCASADGFAKMEPNISAILRALFSYEIWQVFRREFKGAESNEKITEILNELLGIDFDKYATKLPDIFEEEPDYRSLEFHNEAHFNYEYLDQFVNGKGWYLKYIFIIIMLLKHVADDTLDQISGPKPLSECLKDETFLKKQLGLPADYNFKDFLMYSAVQCLLFPTTNERVDQEGEKMNITDLKDPEEIKNLIKKYVTNQYKSKYDSERVKRRKLENSTLLNLFLHEISTCTDRKELIRLFLEGVKKGAKTFTYKGFGCLGYIELKQLVLDTSKPIPLRKDLLKMFLLACDTENYCRPLFNGGKTAAVQNIDDFRNVFVDFCGGSEEDWDLIFAEYKIRSIHSYRNGKPNRHGHHNGKPSYWALGYCTLAAYATNHSRDEFEEYCRIHYNCCGVNHYKLVTETNE